MFYLIFAETNNLENKTINSENINYDKFPNKESKEKIKFSKQDYIILLILTIICIIPFIQFWNLLIHEDAWSNWRNKGMIICIIMSVILLAVLPLIFTFFRKFPIKTVYIKMLVLFIIISIIFAISYFGALALFHVLDKLLG